jgi:hypothetical protein
MVPTPENIPLLIGHVTENQAPVIEAILKGRTDLQKNLLELGYHWDVKVWFKDPVEIYRIPRWIKKKEEDGRVSVTRTRNHTSSVHVFHGFFTSNEKLCYKFRRTGRHGGHFPSLELVTRYEPVIASHDEFTSYEQFKAKFDLNFITEDQILGLWTSKSGQHGGQYKPSDFRSIGPRGKEVLRRFLMTFKGVSSTDTTGYHQYGNPPSWSLSEKFYSNSPNQTFGRDVSISHTLGIPRVYYSSEYPGCGNGRYGLLVNKNEYLWIEDD